MSGMDLRDTYDAIASQWDDAHAVETYWVPPTERFLSLLPPGGRVLDAGCGAGLKAAFITAKGFDVVGIDLSPKMIEIARTRAPNADFRVGDLGRFHWCGRPFDGVYAQASLLHVPKADWTRTVRHLASKLAPGGLFYACLKERTEGRPSEEMRVDHDYGFPIERFFSYFTEEEAAAHFAAAGLDVLETSRVTTANAKPWIAIIARKK